MKRRITILIFAFFASLVTNAQVSEITNSTLRETFTGSYNGNYFCCGGEPETYVSIAGTNQRAYINFLDNTNPINTVMGARLYGTSNPLGMPGNMEDALDILANTPQLASYDGVNFSQSNNFDSRSFLIYGIYGPTSVGTIPGLSFQNFSIKVTNHETTSALVRISFAVDFLVVYCCITEAVGSDYVYTIPGNSTMYISQPSNVNNVKAVKIQTANFVGRMTFDDLRLGFNGPTTFDFTAAGAATSIVAGNTLQFTSTSNSPEYGETIWSVINSNQVVTSIDGTGLLTASPATSVGYLTVTGVSAYNKALSKSYILNVQDYKPATGLEIFGPDTIYVSLSYTIYTTGVLPLDATDKSIFSLKGAQTGSSALIVTSAAGILLKGLASGVVTITAIHIENSNTITGFKLVHILTTIDGITDITGPTIVNVGGTVATYSCIIHPADAFNKNIVWNTVPAQIAGINSLTGVLNPLMPGIVTVTGTSISNAAFSKSLVVTILGSVIAVDNITITGPTTVTVGELNTYLADISPSNATDKTVIWSVSGSLATINSVTGILSPLNVGVVTVTGTCASNSSFYNRLVVTITGSIIAVNSISVFGLSTVTVGELNMYDAEVSPSNAIDKIVIWSVLPGSLATINSVTGILNPLKAGSVMVSATSATNAMIYSSLNVIILDSTKKINEKPVSIPGVNTSAGIVFTTTSPMLHWNAVQGAIGYCVQIASDPSFSLFTYSACGITDTFYVLPASLFATGRIESGSTYYWRVAATFSSVQGAWSGTSSFTISAVTGIRSDEKNVTSFEVYPNPTSGTFTIKISKTSGSGLIAIYNSLGQHIATIPEGESKLPSGLYLIHYGKSIRKLVVE